MSADKTTCFALTEPGAGSDATRVQTRAEEKDGSWVLNGRKHFITGGEEADFALVFAVTDSEKRAKGGITAFFVDADTPGYAVTRHQRTMSPYQNPVEITLEDVEVPEESVLGKVGYGFYSAVKGINGARLQIAAAALVPGWPGEAPVRGDQRHPANQRRQDARTVRGIAAPVSESRPNRRKPKTSAAADATRMLTIAHIPNHHTTG